MKLTIKEKEMFHSWTLLFGKDTELYKSKVDAYFEEKKSIEKMLKEKEGERNSNELFKD